jgi:osmotically-inducible protein OsmY
MVRADDAAASDDEIRAKVEKKLADKEVDNVEVQVKNHAVILNGTVPSAWAAQRAVQAARDVDEADAVVSQLKIAATTSDDSTLGREVAGRLSGYASYDVFDAVTLSIKDGVVTLTGTVANDYKRRELAEMAAKVPGVRDVVNRIELMSLGPMDDNLRVRVADAIYREAVFSRYAAGGRPPIHVIVDHGRVKLIGMVASDLERQKADAIARSVPGSFSVDNQLEVEP